MKDAIKDIILKGLDHQIQPLMAARTAAQRPAGGWLRAVREAIGLTQGQVAAKAAITRQSYAQLEAAEKKDAISIAALRRAADAMDCEVVYFIVPRESVARTYADLAQTHDPVLKHLHATKHSMALEGQSVEKAAIHSTASHTH